MLSCTALLTLDTKMTTWLNSRASSKSFSFLIMKVEKLNVRFCGMREEPRMREKKSNIHHSIFVEDALKGATTAVLL